MPATSPTSCVACREPIQPGAEKCPHCQTDQNVPWWKKSAAFLTTTGKVLIVFSMVFGVDRLNTLVTDVRIRQEAVSELLEAARMQRELLEHASAWNLLEEAQEMDKGSIAVRSEKVTVAMDWIRYAWRQKGAASFDELIQPLLPALQRGAVSHDDNIAASALAHLGWANHLRAQDGRGTIYTVDEYFERALQRQPDNLYANVMRGQWLLSQPSSGSATVDTAIEHFRRAEALEQQTDWVMAKKFAALTGTHAAGGDAVAITEANRYREAGKRLPVSVRKRLMTLFHAVVDEQPAQWLDDVSAGLTPEQLAACYLWLAEGIDFDNDPPTYIDAGTHHYINGLLWEYAGKPGQALKSYRRADQLMHPQNRVRKADWGLSAAMQRVTPVSGGQN